MSVIINPFYGSDASKTITPTKNCQSFSILNEGLADFNIVVTEKDGDTKTLKIRANTGFEGVFNPISNIVITNASGSEFSGILHNGELENPRGYFKFTDSSQLSTPGTAEANKSVVLDSDGRTTTLEITEVVTIDASAGGTGETTSLTLIPANSILKNVTAVVITPFDGDATTTLEVGVVGNADAYIDTSDFDPSAAANTYASSLNGTTNDVKTAQWLATATQLIATWTNTASMTAGEIKVYVQYTKMA